MKVHIITYENKPTFTARRIEIWNKEKIRIKFPDIKSSPKAKKLLLINISTHFTKDRDVSEYDVLEPPLGVIALLSYVNHAFGEKIQGKIIKSRVDFDSYEELNKKIDDCDPDIIGVSTMTFHMDFFHKAIKKIREHGFKKMIIVGGPHPTTSSQKVLEDKNIDLCVIGEGEKTLVEIIEKSINNKKERLDYNEIVNINGIAFSEDNFKKSDFRYK